MADLWLKCPTCDRALWHGHDSWCPEGVEAAPARCDLTSHRACGQLVSDCPECQESLRRQMLLREAYYDGVRRDR